MAVWRLIGDEQKAVKILDALELSTFGASLGGVRTTTQVPSTMAFLDVPADQKVLMNIRDGMIRVLPCTTRTGVLSGIGPQFVWCKWDWKMSRI